MYRFLILLLALTMAACSGRDKVSPPGHILQPEALVALLADVQLAEAQALASDAVSDTVRMELIDNYAYIFALHRTDAATFRESMEWYQRHPRLLHDVYEQVHERLILLQEEMDAH
jgi:hypothetical protein